MGDLFQLTVQRPLIRPNVVWVTGYCSLDDLGDSPLIMKRALGFEEEDISPRAPGAAQCAPSSTTVRRTGDLGWFKLVPEFLLMPRDMGSTWGPCAGRRAYNIERDKERRLHGTQGEGDRRRCRVLRFDDGDAAGRIRHLRDRRAHRHHRWQARGSRAWIEPVQHISGHC